MAAACMGRVRLALGARPGVRTNVIATVGMKAEHRGVRQDPRTPYYFVDAFGRPMSPWHDIPTYCAPASEATPSASASAPSSRAKYDPAVVSCVCEIPRGTRAKFEIATGSAYNPIVQDRNADGTPRFYAFDSLSNYGAIPQTYEDPTTKDARTGMVGDGDPLDVCEIGLRSKAEVTGSVYEVRVLGALAMIDGGETDWKILAVRTDDPLAAQVTDCKSAPASVRRLMDNIRTWFRTYKVPEGKGENEFAFGGKWLDRDSALQIIHECHEQWKTMVKARAQPSPATLYGTDAALAASASGPWVWPRGEQRRPTFNSVEHALATMRIQRDIDLK